MRVTNLQTQNFKGLPDEQYEFGGKNEIYGKNGAGKSSIADAILFALYGKVKSGNRETDKLIKNDAESCKVGVVFDTGTTVVREQSRFYGTTILLNGEKIEQNVLEENLPDFKIFASVFIIGNFFNYSEDEQRQSLLGLTPDIDLKKLFIAHTRDESLLEKWPIDFSNIDAENKTFKKRLKDLKAVADRNKQQIEFNEAEIKNMKKPKKIDTAKIEKELAAANIWAEYFAEQAQYDAALEKAHKSKNCPTCGQALSETHKIELPKEPKEPKVKAVGKSVYEVHDELKEAEFNNKLLENYEEEVLNKRKVISKLEEEIGTSADAIADLELIVGALSPKGIKASQMRSKTDSLLKPLKELIPNIDIQTLAPLKTKEDFKEVFKLTVGGIEYKFLSSGEKKRVDIAISTLINDLTDAQVNMFFLDDAELLDLKDPLTEGQVFYAYVTSGDIHFTTSN